MRKFLFRLMKLGNVVPILTILLGVMAGFNLTETLLGMRSETVLVTLISLIAAELLIERVGVLADIQGQTADKTAEYKIEMLPRTHPSYRHFHDLVADASDVLVVGIDMGFMARTSAYFLKTAIKNGLNLRLLMIDPRAPRSVRDMIDIHDERNTGGHIAHSHATVAKDTIDTIRNFCEQEGCKGSVEIRARRDIPALSLTLVDPDKRNGIIRVEVKFYKRNHGNVPVLEFDRTNPWYDDVYELYYNRLWNDSPILYSSRAGVTA
jgi:hypothetical protein